MTTVTITLTSSCAGNGHHHFSLTGDRTASTTLTTEEILASPTEEELQVVCKFIARMAKLGRTMAQANTLLRSGVTISV